MAHPQIKSTGFGVNHHTSLEGLFGAAENVGRIGLGLCHLLSLTGVASGTLPYAGYASCLRIGAMTGRFFLSDLPGMADRCLNPRSPLFHGLASKASQLIFDGTIFLQLAGNSPFCALGPHANTIALAQKASFIGMGLSGVGEAFFQEKKDALNMTTAVANAVFVASHFLPVQWTSGSLQLFQPGVYVVSGALSLANTWNHWPRSPVPSQATRESLWKKLNEATRRHPRSSGGSGR